MIVKFVHNHFKAGHDLSNKKLTTDLETLSIDLNRILDVLRPPPTNEQKLSFIVREIVKLNRSSDIIMGRLDSIIAALDAAGSTAADEAAQVNAHFAALRDQVAQLQAALDALSASTVTDEDIADLEMRANALADAIEAIDTEGDAGPDPEPEPEPTPEEPPVV